MAKDKRIKGCYNLECRRYRKEYKYKATDNFCTICGTELVYVCAECFEKITGDEVEARLCATCSAKHEARKEAVKTGANKAKGVVVAGVHLVPEAIKFAKSDNGKALIKSGAKIVTKLKK